MKLDDWATFGFLSFIPLSQVLQKLYMRRILSFLGMSLSLTSCHLEPSLRTPMTDEKLSDEISEALTVLEETQGDHLVRDVVCAQCHLRQAEEYARSTMRYGFFSPSFNALELTLNQLSDGVFTTHGEKGSFCSDCHGPAAIELGVEVNDQQSSRSQRSPLFAREGGIGCDLCHSLQEHRAPATGVMATPSRDKLTVHEQLVPNLFHGYRTPTQQTEINVQLSSSEFCAPCHDVRPTIPDMVQAQDHLRSEDLFSEWKKSPWAQADHPLNPLRGQAGIKGVHDELETTARGEVITCQDCHMSLYPQRRFDDEIEYDTHFMGVSKAALTRKAHKVYPIGQSAEKGRLTQGQAIIRRVSTHYFTGVSHPLTPYPSSSILSLDAFNLSLTDEGGEPLSLEGQSSNQSSNQSSEDWWDERLISSDRWRSMWSDWRKKESGQVDRYGDAFGMHERRKTMLKSALTLDITDTPTEISKNDVLGIEAWIENVGAGHHVPAGFSQEREVWVSLELTDEGRECHENIDCLDLVEPPLFLDTANRDCIVHTRTGDVDRVLPNEGSWEEAARKERSAVCNPQNKCVIYRSGYLTDIDEDGRLNDEDLRHSLVERDAGLFEERCVKSGPDADMRLRGVERGLVHFTNALQRVAIDEENQVVEHPNVALFKPTETPYDPLMSVESVFRQDPRVRRSLYPTQRALYEQSRYRPATVGTLGINRQGLGLLAPTLLSANRAFNGHSLAPFEPRLARYDIKIPATAIGPLELEVKVRFRFFSPRLLRTLNARHPELLREEMIDEGLEIVDLVQRSQIIEVRD